MAVINCVVGLYESRPLADCEPLYECSVAILLTCNQTLHNRTVAIRSCLAVQHITKDRQDPKSLPIMFERSRVLRGPASVIIVGIDR